MGSGSSIAVLDGANGSALRIMSAGGGGESPLLDCPAAECSGLVWSPDGRRLIYERRPWADGRYGSPRLYWLDAATGETLPLLDEDTPGYGARFSPDGAWLSYVSPPDEGVVLYRLGRRRAAVAGQSRRQPGGLESRQRGGCLWRYRRL